MNKVPKFLIAVMFTYRAKGENCWIFAASVAQYTGIPMFRLGNLVKPQRALHDHRCTDDLEPNKMMRMRIGFISKVAWFRPGLHHAVQVYGNSNTFRPSAEQREPSVHDHRVADDPDHNYGELQARFYRRSVLL